MPFGFPAFPYSATNASAEQPDFEKNARPASSYAAQGSGGKEAGVKFQQERTGMWADVGSREGSTGMQLEKGRV